MDHFTLKAAPGTDIWRKPPTTDIYNAPTSPPPTYTPGARGLLSAFRSARISFTIPYREQYDQAGLVLSLQPPSSSFEEGTAAEAGAPPPPPPPPKWIKTGVEYYNSNPMLSTVACDTWADWSVTPLLRGTGAEAEDGREWTTVSIVREQDGKGMSLWVYQVVQGSGGPEGAGEVKVPLREICWVFGAETHGWELTVEAMAARPEKAADEALSVDFRGFDVRWADVTIEGYGT